MAHSIPVNGTKIVYMEKENTPGMMGVNMKEIGKIIIWMALVYTPGKMAENMKVITKKIKSTVKVCIPGLMEESTTDNGRMEGKMEGANTYLNKDNTEREFG